MDGPKLRTAEKVKPPYPLGKFPSNFPLRVASHVVYRTCTQTSPKIEGEEWEEIFADAIGARWTPSNIGLDDVKLGVCAWGLKSLKATNPFTQKIVRLISGRNSPVFSYRGRPASNDAALGKQVLEIWNTRVESLRDKFAHLRTVVFMKSNDLTKITVFEMETIRYSPDMYTWSQNKRNNLEGHEVNSGFHKFTWQPHGSQFTIIEEVPKHKLCFSVRPSPKFPIDTVLKHVGYDETWVTITSS